MKPLITFKEAADLALQISLSLALVAGGVVVANVTTNGRDIPVERLDVDTPTLWSSVPVRIDHTLPDFIISVHSASAQSATSAGNGPCLNPIGLRVACDLLDAASQSS
jgi:hypothetical protein